MASAEKIIDVFNEAKARPTEAERLAYVAEACAGDPELKQQVLSLLKAHEAAANFLQPSPLLPPTVLITEKAGDTIGRYKLLEQIGEGGCGVVYMAEQQEPVRRRVALKVIKLGMDTKQVIARFEAERQALALMDHPNIAKVHDGGATDTGRPFFVMELVRGIKITDYCDQNNLSTNERLELFIQVCQAIQHAHHKGIIHRDIKPSNILVTQHDDVAVPKVIDFGIAKATTGQLTDKTLFTAFAQFIGTPAYMSPEQAQMSGLDIDTRSDIYSLGVLLYELLTGNTPFDAKELLSAGLDEMRRKIREDEPAKPSTCLSTMQVINLTEVAKLRHVEPPRLIHLLRGDLDWLVMKCLEKDRTRRYETANGLALDIRRFLADEPVCAMPPSAGYRFGKFARRNKVALRVTGAIAAVLVTATIVSSWQAIRATRAEKLAGGRLIESEHARAEAEASAARAMEAERKATANATAERATRQEAEGISTFMSEVFQSPDPSRDGRTITVADTLDKAAKKLETDLADQPARRARLQATLGKTYYSLGLFRQAIPLQEKALEYYRTASGPEHPDTLTLMSSLAASYHQTAGRLHEALELREQLVALRRKVSGPQHRDTLWAMLCLADSYFAVGQLDEALKRREEVIPIQRKVLGPEHPDTLTAMHRLATSYGAVGRHAEALKLREEVLALRRRLLGPEHPETLWAMQNVAFSYDNTGRRDEALKLREDLLPLFRRVLGPEHVRTVIAIQSLATSYHNAGREGEALKLREEVLTIRRNVAGREHSGTLRGVQNSTDSSRANGDVVLEKEIAVPETKAKPASKVP